MNPIQHNTSTLICRDPLSSSSPPTRNSPPPPHSRFVSSLSKPNHFWSCRFYYFLVFSLKFRQQELRRLEIPADTKMLLAVLIANSEGNILVERYDHSKAHNWDTYFSSSLSSRRVFRILIWVIFMWNKSMSIVESIWMPLEFLAVYGFMDLV